MVWKNYLVIIGFWLLSSSSFALSTDELSLVELSFLKKISENAERDVSDKIEDIEKVLSCFELNKTDCPSRILTEFQTLIKYISESNFQYRTWVAILNWKAIQGGRLYINYNGFPTFKVSSNTKNNTSLSVYQVAQRIIWRDQEIMNQVTNHQLSRKGFNPTEVFEFSPERQALYGVQVQKAKQIYRANIESMISRLPFLVYIKSESPDNHEVYEALKQYKGVLNESKEYLSKDKDDVAEYLFLTSSILDLLEEKPNLEPVFKSITEKVNSTSKFEQWLSKNLSSIVALGFGLCSLTSTLAGPAGALLLGLPCGAAATSLNVKNLVEALQTRRKVESHWMAGLTSYKDYKERNQQVAYNSLMLALNGSGLFSSFKATAGIRNQPLATSLIMGAKEFSQNATKVSALWSGLQQTTKGKLKSMAKEGGISGATNNLSLSEDEVCLVEVNLPKEIMNESMNSKLRLVTSRFSTYSDLVELENVARRIASVSLR